MRAELSKQKWLKQEGANLSIEQLLDKVAPGFPHPEGIFYPDTYVFERGASDLTIYQQAHQQLDRKSTRLNSSHSQQSRMPSSA